MEKAVVLLSGGLDSATAAALAKNEGFDLYGLTLSYGQKHDWEIQAAKQIANHLGFQEHRILDIALGQWGGSALIRPEAMEQKSSFRGKTPALTIPVDRTLEEMTHEIPATYVPARNTVFLALALAWAEVLEAPAIFIGVNAVDYSGYPDCRPEFIAAFDHLARLATKTGVEKGPYPRIQAPLLHLNKAQIIQKGMALDLDYGLTLSCYQPEKKGIACGRCDSCRLRLKGFEEAGFRDPARYAEKNAP